MSAFSRDLLPNLTPKVAEIELSLGLSLNGRFGVDPTAEKLTRSSSIPDSMEPLPSLLLRTCSLPVQKEEELRKRREIQSLRRLESKRKRTEKQRKSIKIPNCAPVVVGDSPRQPRALSQQGSVGSQGSGSLGVLEPDSLHLQGANKTVAANSREMLSNGHTVSTKQGTYMVRDVLENMPCVSTKGDNPGGKRIEGFLYRYSKWEEVRILCVCHGSFLSPAEFVRHAGGGDVAHPLRHIVVNHSPLL